MSILQGHGRVEFDLQCNILSADEKKGTDFEANFFVDGEEYKVTIHSSKKLNEDQCLNVIRKNLDMMAILSESYLGSEAISGINYNPQTNKVTRDYTDLSKKGSEIDVDALGYLLEDRLRSNELKKDHDIVEASSSADDHNEDEKVELDWESPALKKRKKIEEKVKHIQKAIELYHLWKTGGGIIEDQPGIGEIIIESKEAPPRQTKTAKESWWKKEWEELIEKLTKRKEELGAPEFAIMEKRAHGLRKESFDNSDKPGWSLGKDFTEALEKDEILREAWDRFLIKEKIKETDLYKEHMESILNAEPEEIWQNKKSELTGKFRTFFESVKDEVTSRVQKIKFFEQEQLIFNDLVSTQPWSSSLKRKQSGKEKEKEKEKDTGLERTEAPTSIDFKAFYDLAKVNNPEIIQYRSRALLKREKSNKPGWSLNIDPKIKAKDDFGKRWSNFLKELGVPNEEALYQILIFYGFESKSQNEDLPFGVLLEILQHYFHDYARGIDFEFYGEPSPYYEKIKNSAAVRETLRRIGIAMLSAA